jgi:hypothetical protein
MSQRFDTPAYWGSEKVICENDSVAFFSLTACSGAAEQLISTHLHNSARCEMREWETQYRISHPTMPRHRVRELLWPHYTHHGHCIARQKCRTTRHLSGGERLGV